MRFPYCIRKSNQKRRLIMNVLLLYPEFPDTFWSYKHALSFVGKKATFPPLGLLTVHLLV